MFHVKHSSSEAEPPEAAGIFGDALPLARMFHEDLLRHGEELGLIGPREIERLWTRHLINSALLSPLVPAGTLADIGSGAGFPGLVLALMRPDVQCTLIEPMERRAQWLRDESQRLGLENVEVLRARAEEVPTNRRFDSVTARAVSALKKLIPMAYPLVASGGQMVFLKGQKVADEVEAARSILRPEIFSSVDVVVVGPEWNTEETRVFRATLVSDAN
jgi:16S rRNA (guanine527-N7)-methyltransferase